MAGKKVLPPTYLLLSIVLMIGLHFFVPGVKIIPFPWTLAGLLPLIMGVAIAVVASNMFSKVKTTIKPYEESTFLVTDGTFRFSRNPMYLGMVLVLIGVATFLGTLTPYLVVLAFFFLIDTIFIRVEEKMLEEKFGKTYLNYKQQVRRWI